MYKKNIITKATFLFFILFFVVGVFTFKDYGISFDEGFQRTLIGKVNCELIISGNSSTLHNEFEKYYGPAFEIMLYGSERIFNVTDPRNIFLLRHFISFLLFFIATIFFYFLSLKIFKKNHIALLSCVCLVLSPRIFAESFYNSKDLAMLCFSIIAVYTMYVLAERQTILTALIHAATCGFLIDVRITGILFPFVTIYFLLFQKTKKIIPILTFIFYLPFFIIAFWPFLWQNPVHNFIEAFSQMSKFPWVGTVLYLGKYTLANQLPWHYLFVWIGISTPIPYIIFFLTGFFFILKTTLTNFYSALNIHPALLLVILPLGIILILNSVVYDSWRHVFFIYPFFILTAIYGIVEINKRLITKNRKSILKIVLILSFSSTLFFMISNHPLNNIYFNLLAGKDVRHRFEMDYWGLSYKKGLEYILDNDKSNAIYVYDGIGLASLNLNIIKTAERKRLIYTDDKNLANYYFCNYRWHIQEYTDGVLFYKMEVDNEKILEIRKLR